MDNREKDDVKEDKNLQEILDDEGVIAEDVDPSDTGELGEEDKKAEEEGDELTSEESEEPKEPKEPKEPEEPEEPESKEEFDYKKKYSDSSREATALHFKNKKITDTIEASTNLPEPTEEELKIYAMKELGATYEDLDEFSQKMVRKTYTSERKSNMIAEIAVASKDLDKWAKRVNAFTESPETLAKYPSITDHETAFRKYAMKEQRRGANMEDLVAAFLYGMQTDDPKPKKAAKKKSMLLSGGGGGDSVPKPKTLTAEELRIIRTRDPKRYQKLVKQGKAGIDVLDRE